MNVELMTRVAVKEALKSSSAYRHGCVVFNTSRILSKGFNKSIYFCHDETRRMSLHAEMSAIRNLPKKMLRDSTVLVVRISKGQNLLIKSFPCIKCVKIMGRYGIKKIYCSDSVGNIVPFFIN